MQFKTFNSPLFPFYELISPIFFHSPKVNETQQVEIKSKQTKFTEFHIYTHAIQSFEWNNTASSATEQI